MDKEDIEKQNEIKAQHENRGIFNKEIVNASEACLYMRIAKSTLYKLTSARKITHYCPQGKLIYFKKSDLDQFLLKNKQETVEESVCEAKKFINLNHFKAKNSKK
ncbi:MAG: helix-turn-helix domain-containing protein [Saprospiraceae bacterium]|nr:helix-turn-helix domain-containing protein [Saprospiraceae bacterium]